MSHEKKTRILSIESRLLKNRGSLLSWFMLNNPYITWSSIFHPPTNPPLNNQGFSIFMTHMAITHRIHVWYIYLHEWLILMVFMYIGKYTNPMGIFFVFFCEICFTQIHGKTPPALAIVTLKPLEGPKTWTAVIFHKWWHGSWKLLKLTNRTWIHGWLEVFFLFPFGARPVFRCELLVLGRLFVEIKKKTEKTDGFETILNKHYIFNCEVSSWKHTKTILLKHSWFQTS